MKQNRLFIEKRDRGDYACGGQMRSGNAVEPMQAKAKSVLAKSTPPPETSGARQTYVERQARSVAKRRSKKIAHETCAAASRPLSRLLPMPT